MPGRYMYMFTDENGRDQFKNINTRRYDGLILILLIFTIFSIFAVFFEKLTAKIDRYTILNNRAILIYTSKREFKIL